MGQVNGFRVAVMVLGIAALGWSILCPWWQCRVTPDSELLAKMEAFKEFPDIALGIAENRLAMVPLWRIDEYGFAELSGFNIVQLGAVLALWALGMAGARDFDAPRAALPGEAARELDARHRGINEPGACPPVLR